jgi:hypothetical protein
MTLILPKSNLISPMICHISIIYIEPVMYQKYNMYGRQKYRNEVKCRIWIKAPHFDSSGKHDMPVLHKAML